MQATAKELENGHRVWIWSDDLRRGGPGPFVKAMSYQFTPFLGAVRRIEVIVPPGWVGDADIEQGIVLTNDAGERLTACNVFTLTRVGGRGFSDNGWVDDII